MPANREIIPLAQYRLFLKNTGLCELSRHTVGNLSILIHLR